MGCVHQMLQGKLCEGTGAGGRRVRELDHLHALLQGVRDEVVGEVTGPGVFLEQPLQGLTPRTTQKAKMEQDAAVCTGEEGVKAEGKERWVLLTLFDGMRQANGCKSATDS